MTTYSFVVSNSGPVAVVSQGTPSEILIMENDQAGTTDYTVQAPTLSNAAVTRPAGSQTRFTPQGLGIKYFYAGQIVGYVQTIAGSITMVQMEL